MIKVCVLGVGKVGSHLIKECVNHPDINLIQVYNRSSKGLRLYKGILSTTQSVYELQKADIYVVALPDDVIHLLDLTHLNGLVVHTSGTKSYSELNAKRKGVFYPAQSFTKEKKVNFRKTPFCLETEFSDDYPLLEKFTILLTDFCHQVDEYKRQKLHLAAVFANNFSNRMIGIAYEICNHHQIDFDILQPLIQETFLKTQIFPPHVAQTGPAVRNDRETIIKHISQLENTDKEIYQILTKSIQEKHDAEL
ncbi:Rossmann-like and DUF2520 domain-containing protein [Wenyingzhuangia sp. IMCC45533]